MKDDLGYSASETIADAPAPRSVVIEEVLDVGKRVASWGGIFLGATTVVALTAAPWLAARVLPVAFALVGASVLISWLPCLWLRNALVEVFDAAPAPRQARLVRAIVAGTLGAFVAVLGIVISNIGLADELKDPATLVGSALGVLLGVLTGVAAARSRTATLIPPTLNVVAAFAVAISAAIIATDASGFPTADFAPHAVVLSAIPLSLLGIMLTRGRTRRVALPALVALGVVACVAGAIASIGSHGTDRAFAELASSHTIARRILTLARRATDRDGDGYSALLGGGDCDDHDPRSYPLSTMGTDCVGFMPTAGRETEPTALAPVARAASAPRFVVLVTVDALRCHRSAADPDALRSACDALERVGEGGISGDTYAHYPSTRGSVPSLFRGHVDSIDAGTDPRDAPSTLASDFRDAGYVTSAIATHRYVVADAAIRDSFDEIDLSLSDDAASPIATTSARVTTAVEARLERAARRNERAFVWAHYLDPHAPYIHHEGSRIVTSRVAAYAAEVARTTESVERLVRALERPPYRGNTLVVITADHGEEFGEHEATHHGYSLYEPAVHVPFVATGVLPRGPNGRPVPVPPSLSQVRAYFRAVLTEAAPEYRAGALLLMADGPSHQIGWAEGGLKLIYWTEQHAFELYDVRHDPGERTNLAYDRTLDVRRLGARLGLALTELESVTRRRPR